MATNERKPETGSAISKILSRLNQMTNSMDARYQRHLLMFLLALLLTFIIIPKGGFTPGYYNVGDIASRDVKAPRELLIPDDALTDKKRIEAEEAVLPVYDFDPEAGVGLSNRLQQALDLSRKEPTETQTAEDIKSEIENLLGISLDDKEAALLQAIARDDEAVRFLRIALTDATANKIVANLQLFDNERERGVAVRDLATGEEIASKDFPDVIGLEDATALFGKSLDNSKLIKARQKKQLKELISKVLRPNLTFNKGEYEERRASARESVAAVVYQIKQGEMIVREGERVTADQVERLKALSDIGSDLRNLQTAMGLLILTIVLLFVCHKYGSLNIRKYKLNNRDLLFLATTFIGLFVLIKISIFVSTALESAFPYINSSSYFYAVPFAVGAMLVRIVLNSEVAIFFSVLVAMLVGIFFGNSLFLTFYALAGSLTGAHWVRHCAERTKLYKAGLRLSLVNLVVLFGLQLLAGSDFDLQMLYKAGFGLANGLICAVIVTGTIPLVEYLFKYTTDIKLLELANMNSPVLRDLMVQAPGTYHHSVVVGNLVEAAAEDINANPLMARVAAYYHDIGKMKKPLYFIENVGVGENKHDKLAPSMSALILMAHLKDGVEIAREHKLGGAIIDVIREHHGTGLMKFFYDKAKNQVDENVQHVDERDYRYPGPKPQTREAALIMLADAVEAAGRTLTDPTPARIRGMVQKIINNIFIDGQLDECELTLKDLHKIANSFEKVLAGIFHHRVDYPEPVYKENIKDKASEKKNSNGKNGKGKKTEKKKSNDPDREPSKEPSDSGTDSSEGSSKDLKRLGMS
jgi:putative nucleotidyltransferase with HDIG domain